MKKLTQAFLWTCTALFLGQLSILTLSAVRGHFSKDTLTHIVALLSGINIRGEQIGAAIRQAKTFPVPTPQEVLTAKIKSTLDSDSKMASLNRIERELQEKEKLLNQERDRLAQLVAERERDEEARNLNGENESLRQVTDIIQSLDPAEAKVQLSKMLEKQKKNDVISILTNLDADKQKKILAEYTEEKDREDLAKILEEIRTRGKVNRDPTKPEKSPQP